MAKDWISIRVKTEAQKFDAVRNKIMGWPEEVAKEVYWPQLEAIGANGKAYMQEIIATNTDTKKYRETGVPGRIKSEKMFRSVQSLARPRKNGFSLFVGWNRGQPGYSIFQELGTKNGIVGMNAVGQSREYMLSQLKAMAAGKYISTDPSTVTFSED